MAICKAQQQDYYQLMVLLQQLNPEAPSSSVLADSSLSLTAGGAPECT